MKDSKKSRKIIPIRDFDEAKNVKSESEETRVDLDSAKEKINEFFDFILDKIKLLFPHRSLEQLSDMCSEKIDSLILQEEQNKNYRYIGGQLLFIYMDNQQFRITVELYFKNQKDEWIEVKSASQPRSMEYLMKDSIMELKEKGQVAFEIEAPKRRL